MNGFKIGTAACAALLGAMALAAPAHAADNVMQACGAKYQAAKKANQLGGQTWNQYLAACRASMKGSAPAAAAAPVAMPKPVAAAKPTAAPHVKGQPSAAQSAMYAREKQCGQQWKADKAANKVPAGMKWPQYWSACNKRMKG
jgi:hypothetical protein